MSFYKKIVGIILFSLIFNSFNFAQNKIQRGFQTLTACSKLPLAIMANKCYVDGELEKQKLYEIIYYLNDLADILLKLEWGFSEEDLVDKSPVSLLEVFCSLGDLANLVDSFIEYRNIKSNKDLYSKDQSNNQSNTQVSLYDDQSNDQNNKKEKSKFLKILYSALKHSTLLADSISSLTFALSNDSELKNKASQLNFLVKYISRSIDNKNVVINNKFMLAVIFGIAYYKNDVIEWYEDDKEIRKIADQLRKDQDKIVEAYANDVSEAYKKSHQAWEEYFYGELSKKVEEADRRYYEAYERYNSVDWHDKNREKLWQEYKKLYEEYEQLYAQNQLLSDEHNKLSKEADEKSRIYSIASHKRYNADYYKEAEKLYKQQKAQKEKEVKK